MHGYMDTEYLLRPEHMTQQLKSNVHPKLPGYAYTWAPVVAYIGIGIYAGMDFYKRVYLVNAHVSPYEPVIFLGWLFGISDDCVRIVVCRYYAARLLAHVPQINAFSFGYQIMDLWMPQAF